MINPNRNPTVTLTQKKKTSPNAALHLLGEAYMNYPGLKVTLVYSSTR